MTESTSNTRVYYLHMRWDPVNEVVNWLINPLEDYQHFDFYIHRTVKLINAFPAMNDLHLFGEDRRHFSYIRDYRQEMKSRKWY